MIPLKDKIYNKVDDQILLVIFINLINIMDKYFYIIWNNYLRYKFL